MGKLSLLNFEWGGKEKRSAGSSTLSNPAQWLLNLFGAQSKAGVSVTPENSLTFSAVYDAGRNIAETIGSLPRNVFKRLDRGKEIARNHHLQYIIHTRPNPYVSSLEFNETIVVRALYWGAGYARIYRDSNHNPQKLILLHTNEVEEIENKGKQYYRHKGEVIESENMLHINNFFSSFGNRKGIIHFARESLGMGLALQDYGSSFFGNGANIGGVIEVPQKLNTDSRDRIEKVFNRKFQGNDGAHKVAFIDNGMKFHKVGLSPTDAQALETRHFSIEEVCRWFNVSPHRLKHLTRSTYNNIEHQDIEFVKYTLRPWAKRLDQEYTYKLFSQREKPNHFIKTNLDGLLRGDMKSRAEFYRTLFNLGAISSNEIRELENMNPQPDGDKYYVQLNMSNTEHIDKIQLKELGGNEQGEES
ncbi:phage portal protein [Xanthovirga aplysinae]|uniref:phage portal protein n=1 Tax=Xanthovirga aplysinae TaxID=2529853 RepID=UPI0012BCD555